MRNLLFILMLLPIIGWSQIAVVPSDSIFSPWKIQKPLDEQYLDWRNADSNKVLVGYEFILTDRKLSVNGWTSQEFYNPQYRALLKDNNPDWIKFIYGADWSDPDHVWYVAYMNEKFKNRYYEAIPIKMSIEPTFEGFIRWKKRFNKQ